MAGLTETGFEAKRLDQIKAELEADFKESFGSDTDVSDESPDGLLIGLMSKSLAEIWEALEAIYSSMDPDQAKGISLDRACHLTGTERLESSKTEVSVILEGDEGTVIDDTFIGRQKETLYLFSPESGKNVTITKTNAIKAVYSINSIQNNHLYTIYINTVNYDYTSDSDATNLEIIAGLKASIDIAGLPLIVTDNLDGTLTILAEDFITSFSTDVSSEIDIDSAGVLFTLFSQIEGSILVPENTLTEIDTPVSGLNNIDNLLPGITGRETEEDSFLRQRRRDDIFISGGGTDDSIAARIKRDVPSIVSCRVISNRTLETVDGIPAKSFETIVTGGKDGDIAQKIWQVQPSGVEPFGNTTIIVKDSQGKDQIVKFSRVVNKYVFLYIEFEQNSEETLPSDWLSQIKNKFILYGATLKEGDDLFQQKLYSPLYQVSGVGRVLTLNLAVTDNPEDIPTYGQTHIEIKQNEIAVFAEDRITAIVI